MNNKLPFINYYDFLGISVNASDDDIKKAYRKKAHEYHPDKTGTSETFNFLKEVRDLLLDKTQRSEYNRKLADVLFSPDYYINTSKGKIAVSVTNPDITGKGTHKNPLIDGMYKEIVIGNKKIITPLDN